MAPLASQARTLERRAIPDDLWQLTLARYPFLAARSDASPVEKLRELSDAVPGAEGIQRRRAASRSPTRWPSRSPRKACLPALELGLEWFDGFVGIVVHADAVVARREIEDEDGVVHAFDEELSGEAMSGGPVMLAWQDVDEAGESAGDGYNVVVHEFAHVIDMRGGVTARLDEVDPTTDHGLWLNALADEYERFASRIDADEETFLDPYGAEALEEFFAVAAEAFFVAPRELLAGESATYGLLKSFFKQDPAREK